MAPQYPSRNTRSAANSGLAPTTHSLALLSHALSELRSQCPHAPQVGYASPAGQEFSRLALSGAIVWDEVRAALNRFYGDAGQPGGPPLGGDFGLELVQRVVRRFERFQLGTDGWEASSWCKELEQGVWEVVKQHGGHQTEMPQTEEQDQQEGQDWRARNGGEPAKGSGAEFGRQADPFASHQQNGTPQLGAGSYGGGQPSFSQQHQPQYHQNPQQYQGYPAPRPPPYHDTNAPPRAGGGRFDSPAQQQQGYGGEIVSPSFSRGTSSILGPDLDEGAEEDVKPRVGAGSARGATDTPKKESKDRMAVGSLVQAKMFGPRDKGVNWPCMIFESSPIPSGVYGKQSATTYLVAPLPVKNEWHWVPPSRLRPIASSRIPKLLAEADTNLSTFQAQYHTASTDPTLQFNPGKQVLVDALKRKVAEAEDSVKAWRMICGAQGEGEGAWMDDGAALEEWKEARKEVQESGEGGEGEGVEGLGSPASGFKSEGGDSVETGSPATPATEHEPIIWCFCGKTTPGEVSRIRRRFMASRFEGRSRPSLRY
ncbi:hypothetical protein BCR35DRAFT_121093 [Leucosporidium creatinivorum]|uniref:Uncharacterized protein n=1 Tax=Leucosporidium creatinivorum TaxID=106004 RepID=A0A1Y2F0R4_9BASI|nr:hypothetical protein BCR35DRAFT_121093 [Leucosporidium creatinivorum]